MRTVYKDGFGVGHVISDVGGSLSVKWVESGALTEEKEKDVRDVLLS